LRFFQSSSEVFQLFLGQLPFGAGLTHQDK
jgi:hypothetical protein